tara:strand:- start:476 stop:1018 length:543 start_codon:yes stop_codon:yes gene_type:complete
MKIYSLKNKMINDSFFMEEIKKEDINRLNLVFKYRGEKYKKKVKEYLDKPDEFIGLFIYDNNSDVSAYTCWIRTKSFYESKIRRNIKLSCNEAFFTDAYCVPEYRGNGLHSYMMKERINYCFNNNINQAYIVIQAFNTPALKVAKRLKYKKMSTSIIYNKGSIIYYSKAFIKKILLRIAS